MAISKKPKKLAQEMDRIVVRLPDGLRERLAQLAALNGRSMTQETVAAIEQHITRPDRLAVVEAFIERYRADIEMINALAGDSQKFSDRLDDIRQDLNDRRDR